MLFVTRKKNFLNFRPNSSQFISRDSMEAWNLRSAIYIFYFRASSDFCRLLIIVNSLNPNHLTL